MLGSFILHILCTQSDRYCGACALWMWCMNRHSLCVILYANSSQGNCHEQCSENKKKCICTRISPKVLFWTKWQKKTGNGGDSGSSAGNLPDFLSYIYSFYFKSAAENRQLLTVSILKEYLNI